MTTANIKFIKVIEVIDPDSGLPVEIQIMKDYRSGALVGVDGSYLANTDEPIYSPYEIGVVYAEDEL